MTSRFDVLTQQLFQKNIADCSVEELQQLANNNPYFAPAQYALLLKLKEADYSGYEKQFQKAILYYHDPLAFDQFINEDKYQVEETAFEETEALLPVEVKDEMVELPDSEVYQGSEEKEEAFPETIMTPQEIVADKPEEIIAGDNEAETVATPSEEINSKSNESEAQDVFQPASEEITESKTETPALADMLIKAPIQNEPTTGNGLVFEPYHTVDYFASQGIKLSQEEATKDKFGKQLKSFTEWLKTMKRVPVVEQVKTLDTLAEQKVETLAAHSVEGGDVYTETMAEVWMQQGNKEKAIEIYNKLSLLNPSKRAYFAAKINSLN